MADVTDLFRSLADPTRLRILALLRAMELSVGELAQVLGQSQPRVSRHVKILIDAGLAERRKEGSWVFLSLGDGARVDPLFAMLDRWAEIDGEDPWMLADAARLAAVRADRAAAAERYFAQHANHWDEIRSLHIAESEVEAAIGRALADRPVGRLVDVGTGTGRMISLFGREAQHALGVDRSPEMLRLARVKLAEAGLTAAELRQGDMYALPLPAGSADTVILHQVLHFAQQPAAAVAEAARLLAPGGRLLVVDFAAHEREELRIRDAHARLGFADDAVIKYIESAGLEACVIEHLEGGELTVTIWAGERPEAKLKVVA
ncbi:metalloregulator ArsR/SmtB family transcription factor [Sphingosinicella sp. BN140058]|uniref:ArsR/SmtB family transcription factor n=1 Tax=Sphingosinicella sp. BN140058 TaxID=1892855 RepID=UPI0010123F33|nr:metalloregulator ArsR/SmtB family transcription factor [Sphingosinicella sp. BN140058]QAY77656.1 metalloregulator ArsR/SmtB family transcription factor [Sphingosinicella sp. BN140058]